MTVPYPALFISHGAPDLVLTERAATKALQQVGKDYPNPHAVVIISAHWMADPVGITSGEEHPTIHDFYGFPDTLYQLRYPAKGDPVLAAAIAERLNINGIPTKLAADRGLDHGAWIPLMLSYPNADIPIIQVSLPAGNPQACASLGEALSPLSEQGILIIGSGGSVHNLGALSLEGRTDRWASDFEAWLLSCVEENRFDDLLAAEQIAPQFRTAHPSSEHFSPLLVAWAAGDRHSPGRRLHHSFTYGNLGMSIFEFG